MQKHPIVTKRIITDEKTNGLSLGGFALSFFTEGKNSIFPVNANRPIDGQKDRWTDSQNDA